MILKMGEKTKVIFFFNLLLVLHSMWDLVSWLGIEPSPPTLAVWSLNHWTMREVPKIMLQKTGINFWIHWLVNIYDPQNHVTKNRHKLLNTLASEYMKKWLVSLIKKYNWISNEVHFSPIILAQYLMTENRSEK